MNDTTASPCVFLKVESIIRFVVITIQNLLELTDCYWVLKFFLHDAIFEKTYLARSHIGVKNIKYYI